MMNRTNTVLAVLLVAVVVITAGVGVDYSKPNIEILPDMKYTPAWEAFAANPNFPNGQTMQPPVPGTIARGGELPLYYAATKEDAVRAGEELVNPISRSAIEEAVDAESEVIEPAVETPNDASPTEPVAAAPEVDQQNEAARRAVIVNERFAASVERGSGVYLTYCISCHGPKGAGDGPVPQRGFPPPPSMLTGKSLQMKDGQLFHILTYGQGSMAPFAAQLSRDLRWDVINYVRDLQSKAPPVPEAVPVEVAEDATPEPTSEVEVPPAEPPPSKKDADDNKEEKQEQAVKPETPQNDLRDPSSDTSPSVSPEVEEAKEDTEESARE